MGKTEGAPKKRNKISLQWAILLLIFVCWVLPIILLAWGNSYTVTWHTNQRVSDVATMAIENAVDIFRRDLNSVVQKSLNTSYDPTIRQAYTVFAQSGAGVEGAQPGSPDAVEFYNTVIGVLSNEYSRDGLSRSAFIMFPALQDETIYYAYNKSSATADDLRFYNRFYESEIAEAAARISPHLGTDITFVRADRRVFLVRNLADQNLQPYAVMLVELDLDTLYGSLRRLAWPAEITLFVDETILVAAGEPLNYAEMGLAAPPGSAGSRLEESTLYAYGRTDGERFTLRYLIRCDLHSILQEYTGSRLLPLSFILLLIPLMAAVLVFFYRKVNRPIARLSEVTQAIEEGEFGIQLDVDRMGSTEFEYLGNQINAMSARLDEQFERIYREELALRDARIKALQSQINPHFLGNTLETINWEARLAGNEKIAAMLESLTTMLHVVLDRNQQPFIHLSEELMYVNAYLYIIGERLGKRLVVEKQIDESLLDWYIPRLILQPVVENAVEHGVTPRQRGTIIIRIYKTSENWMRLEVENDAPLSPEDVEKIQLLLSGEGEGAGNIGIRNVHQRLRILYGPKSGLTICTNQQGNTVCSLDMRNNPNGQQ